MAISIVFLNTKSVVFGKVTQQTLDNSANRRYQICNDCVPRELVHAPGIGLDLSSSYAYVSIPISENIVDIPLERLQYDTIMERPEMLVEFVMSSLYSSDRKLTLRFQVEGSSEYKDLMNRLSGPYKRYG